MAGEGCQMAEVKPLDNHLDRIKSMSSRLVSVSPHCPSGGTEKDHVWEPSNSRPTRV